ncbi:erythroblast NAD(P)(+)--arginine ADP-ribosyltransferase-like [Eucyclogobius newberryi]|uniref:erythroblast NAD(P)(+)--arginine ADP-ribosyltransferase-like n=1 Tax=Eucyclogobius newberryi TaxID=166745 RepID=UPI003B5C5C5A
MKTIMLTLVLCLVISTTQAREIPLSMMEKSVDDMYQGCIPQMDKKVKDVYFPREIKINPFNDAWKVSKKFAEKKYEKRPDKALTLNQVQALYVYTQEFPNVYAEFNAIVRDGRAKYTTEAFQYHALHFWVSTALQIVNENKSCRTTYRRSKDKYTGKVNEEMRFGCFASSSKEPDLITFGQETCFYIETCLGADIGYYSKMSETESEVLIPPYERFKIKEIAEGSYKEMKDCKKVFVLKSTGKFCNLNCIAI